MQNRSCVLWHASLKTFRTHFLASIPSCTHMKVFIFSMQSVMQEGSNSVISYELSIPVSFTGRIAYILSELTSNFVFESAPSKSGSHKYISSRKHSTAYFITWFRALAKIFCYTTWYQYWPWIAVIERQKAQISQLLYHPIRFFYSVGFSFKCSMCSTFTIFSTQIYSVLVTILNWFAEVI